VLIMSEKEWTPEQEAKHEAALERRRIKARAKTEERAVERIRKAGMLHKTNHPEAINGSYFSLPDGKTMDWLVCGRLIEEGKLVPHDAGLFNDAQTYVVA
jgi:exopolysaccharide biosynthesis protein